MYSKIFIFLLLVILISCQKDIHSQFIQPPKYKNKNISEGFPYVKYTSVKSYSFNKFYTIPKDSLTKALLDSLYNTIDIEMNSEVYKRISYLNGEQLPKVDDIIEDGEVFKKAILKRKLNHKEIQSFDNCFSTEKVFVEWENGKKRPMKPLSKRECIPNYRDAVVFFDGDKPVAWVTICFECYQIKFTLEVKKEIYYYQMTWDKLHDYFQSLGHDVDYHENWQ